MFYCKTLQLLLRWVRDSLGGMGSVKKSCCFYGKKKNWHLLLPELYRKKYAINVIGFTNL